MEDGVHGISEIQVLFKGTKIFLLFLRGESEISLTKGGMKPRIYEGNMYSSIIIIHEREFTLLPSL